MRTIFSPEQLQILEATFARQHYLSVPERVMVAAQLGLSDEQVKNWFQNRRNKWKKELQQHQEQHSAKASGASFQDRGTQTLFSSLSPLPTFLLSSCEQQKLSEEEQVEVERLQVDRSLFVQDLLLSSLAFSDSSSDSSEET